MKEEIINARLDGGMKHKNYYDYRVSTKFKEKANAYSSQFNALECQNQTNITLTKLTKQNKYSLIHITPRLTLKIVLERNSKMNTQMHRKNKLHRIHHKITKERYYEYLHFAHNTLYQR